MINIIRLFNLISLQLGSISGIFLVVSMAVFGGFNNGQNIDASREDGLGSMVQEVEFKEVDRTLVLTKFFEKYNSPLVNNADTFVSVADKYNMDYRILPSIACIESTCGKALIEGTYNPFGWGVYGNQYIGFSSYDEAIEEVGRGLNDNYFSRGFDSLELIAPIYTPPNSMNWLRGVYFFSSEIDDIAKSS